MPIPTLTIRLLDKPLSNKPSTKKLLLNRAKDLIKSFPKQAKEAGVNVDIFHNRAIIYSAIQLGCYRGTPEWTAIGEPAVRALQFWYRLLQKESPMLLSNTIEIKEHYTPVFLSEQKNYQIQQMLVSDQLAKSLNAIHDKEIRYKRLEKYLYGNLQTFFKFIGYLHDKETHFLKVKVLDSKGFKQALPIYHHQKKTAFDLVFTCNFKLPQLFRLGQSTALGYGKVTPL